MDGTAIALIGGIFTGFFALIKYVVSSQEKSNKATLEYITTKNGHMERIATEFSKRIEDSQIILRELTAEISKLNTGKKRR